MKAGYSVIHSVINGDKLIEVINRPIINTVINLGWIFPQTAYKKKDENTVGVWKLKQLKN